MNSEIKIPEVKLVNGSIGSRIKKFRKQQRLTQKQLAVLVDVSPQVISNWERDYSSPSSNDIAKLSNALGCSSDSILNGSDLSDILENIIILEGPVIHLDTLLKDEMYKVDFKGHILTEEERKKILKLVKLMVE